MNLRAHAAERHGQEVAAGGCRVLREASQARGTASAAGNHEEQSKLRTLESERSILVRNISTIYRTAVMELDRKNTEIKGLRTQLEQQQQRQQQQQQQQIQQQEWPLSTEPMVLPPPPPLPPQLPRAPTNVAATPCVPQPPSAPSTLDSDQQGYTLSTSHEPDPFQDGGRRRSDGERAERGRHGSREPEMSRRGSEERMANKYDGRHRSGDAWLSGSKQRERGRDSRERRDEDRERRVDGSRHGKDTLSRHEGSSSGRDRDGERGRRKEEVKEGEERSRASGRDRDRERGDRAGRHGEAEGAKRHSLKDARGRS
eukprot:1137946-Pelagomonas_calceolata.AAC.1